MVQLTQKEAKFSDFLNYFEAEGPHPFPSP